MLRRLLRALLVKAKGRGKKKEKWEGRGGHLRKSFARPTQGTKKKKLEDLPLVGDGNGNPPSICETIRTRPITPRTRYTHVYDKPRAAADPCRPLGRQTSLKSFFFVLVCVCVCLNGENRGGLGRW